jgi:hypothetical protein
MMYECSLECGEAAAALVVSWTGPQVSLLSAFIMFLDLRRVKPPIHDLSLALGIRHAPPGPHQHVIEYLTYKKIKLNLLNLKTNQCYSPT